MLIKLSGTGLQKIVFEKSYLWWFGDNDLDDVGDEPGQVAADEDPHDGDRDAGQSGRSYRSPGFESPTKTLWREILELLYAVEIFSK